MQLHVPQDAQVGTNMKVVVVQHEFNLVIGGPVGPKKTVATFHQGERLTLTRVSGEGEFPKMYAIAEHPSLEAVSKGILSLFVPFNDVA